MRNTEGNNTTVAATISKELRQMPVFKKPMNFLLWIHILWAAKWDSIDSNGAAHGQYKERAYIIARNAGIDSDDMDRAVKSLRRSGLLSFSTKLGVLTITIPARPELFQIINERLR